MTRIINLVPYLFIVSIYVHFTIETREVLYVLPSDSTTSQCNQNTPCLMISQLAETINLHSYSESIQLFFLPGDHRLNFHLEICNISELSMISNSSKIICQSDASFNFQKIGHISIKDLTFLGCGNNKIISSTQFEVVNSLFLGQNESGTALEMINTRARIINCTFAYNTRGNFRGPIQILKFWKRWHKFIQSIYAYVGGAMIVNHSSIAIESSIFEGNRAKIGGAMFVTSGSNVTVFNSRFTNNRAIQLGGALYSESGVTDGKTSMAITGSQFSKNEAKYGGAISTYTCNLSIEFTGFNKNFATSKGGAIEAFVQSKVHVHNCKFWNNKAFNCGAVIGLFNSTLIINKCLFHHNRVKHYAGTLYVEALSAVNISKSGFYENEANSGGAMIVRSYSSAVVHETVFCENYARINGGSIIVLNANLTLRRSLLCNNSAGNRGGAIDAGPSENTTLNIHECEFSNNFVKNLGGGAINAEYTGGANVIMIVRCLFIQNSASVGIGGALLVSSNEVIVDRCSFLHNGVQAAGGAIAVTQSNVHFRNTCELSHNLASYGGAIYGIDSTIEVSTNVQIMFNSAFVLGGGAWLQYSKLTVQYSAVLDVVNNTAATKGGGIYATNSRITVLLNREFDLDSIRGSAISLTNNSAKLGGGVYLELASELFIDKIGFFYNRSAAKRCNFCFISNHANLGGAIYIADETNYEICSSTLKWSHYCFLQSLSPYTSNCVSALNSEIEECKHASVYFEQNTAGAVSGGPVLYGGLLDRCTVRPGSEFEFRDKLPDGFTAFKLLTGVANMSNSRIDTVISSSPVRICPCTEDGQPNCGSKAPHVVAEKGSNFNVSIAAVDQVNHTLENVPVHSSLKYTQSGLGDSQLIQITKSNCTNLSFNVHSPHNSEILTLFAEGPCRNASSSLLKVDITFSACSCPIGFQVKISEVSNCICECDSNLPKYITDCNSHDHTVLRKFNFWITSLVVRDDNISNDYLFYLHCPFDYCLHPDSLVYINLNAANGSDVQCANNRSGILCGTCRPGFSLSLGSSHCIPCSKSWCTDLAAVLVAFVLAGVLLVAFILVLNLTVATGTLNGILFYANVIDLNGTNIYFSSPLTKFLFVFISWLNLEIGLDVCFHESLTMYWKTWLQLAFPTYIIALVIAIIILSRHSITFSMLISKKNPVATLATLVLLSYSKFLRTIIYALSVAKLKLSNGNSYEYIWLADATVRYLQGKHIALFIVATLILIVGAFYTFFLLFWQWLLKWVKYQKLCHFLEPYHAPYIFKHRYWTGLLLLVRIIIYLAMVLNGSGDPSMNLLVIIVAISVILFLKGHIGRIYKSKITDTIETVCYLNVLLLSAAKLFLFEARKDDVVPSFISGLITLLLFLYVLAHHAFTVLCLKQCKKLKHIILLCR